MLDFEEIFEKHLCTEHHLLHHITCKILILRIGRFDYVTRSDIGILYHMLKREKFNFSAMMLRIMQEARMRAKLALPYGMFLTLVFADFGVDVEGESFKRLKHYDTCNEKSLQQMRYKKIEG